MSEVISEVKVSVSDKRKYLVKTVSAAKKVSTVWLEQIGLENVVTFGLPEVDDRYHIWRIPIKSRANKTAIGEIVVDAYSGEILVDRTTTPDLLESRLLRKIETTVGRRSSRQYTLSVLRNTIGFGDSIDLLNEMPSESVDLIFTSPPYFNARPQYSEYEEYEHYLLKMKNIISRCHRVLGEGRFFVMNTSPVLLRRASRSESSKRIGVPFDLHRIFIDEGFDFIDDIIWVKPEGAGWATGRGRRFAADRNPLQYKAVPVTEYLMVYRKRSDMLIDWHIRNHPDQQAVKESKVQDGYEKTNIWRINPNTRSDHPAAFPLELAEKVIRYYSFKHDVVMDPFAGSGTVGAAAIKLDRRFVLYDANLEYVQMMCDNAKKWLGKKFGEVLRINCSDLKSSSNQEDLDI